MFIAIPGQRYGDIDAGRITCRDCGASRSALSLALAAYWVRAHTHTLAPPPPNPLG